MTDTLLVSTRKGLFEVRRHSSGWTVQRASFVGDNVTLALADRRDGCWYAALDHGHFGAKLHRSEDDGETWTVRATGMRANYMPPEQVDDPVIQDPHLVVACAADFDRLWTQHHCGIWRSTDGARSWTEIKQAGPSTFGFAVAVHPREPDTAYFVPAISDQHRVPVDGRVVVTRTRDGGESFDVLRNGLPQNHAYDLVFRHALDIDHTGELLALGSTTGNLWISEDAGDRFTTVSTHLPPVHAVCFV